MVFRKYIVAILRINYNLVLLTYHLLIIVTFLSI
jgi:hypothetical protein